MDFSGKTKEEITAGLEEFATSVKTFSNEELASKLHDATEKANSLFALTTPTIAQVDEAEAIVASIKTIEDEQTARTQAAEDAAERFAAAKTAFTTEETVEAADEDEDEDSEGDDEDKFSAEGATEEDAEAEEAEVIEITAEDTEEEEAEGDTAEAETQDTDSGEAGGTLAASINQTTSQRIKPTAAKSVAKRVKRPKVAETPPVTITAAADVPNFATGSQLEGMSQVTQALLNRTKAFAPFNKQAAVQVNAQNGGREQLHKYGVASFNIALDDSLQATQGNDYAAVKAALKQDRFSEATLTAGGWCAPSETVYSFLAGYTIDGLVTVPEVGAPRGGLQLTTGPARETDLDNFGFVQTEAEAERQTVKNCETIVCPDFEDHRLDAIGYCYKIPLLTQHAYPELVEDALQFASVLYAHKVNKRVITDMLALATPISAVAHGASFTDTLEALSVVATAERRRWHIGMNTVMEVKLPEFVQEVFRADMSRRVAVAVDAITDAHIAAHFTARNLSVEYVADWQDLPIKRASFPGAFEALIYPAGTYIKAIENVINMSAVYDAASLSINEYLGVFFEQGIFVAKAGFGATRIEIPVCTSGATGKPDLECIANGSF